MGALEAPQDRHGQDHRTGTSRVEQTTRRPWRCRELRRPWQVVLMAVASVPSARPLQPEPFYTPKNVPGEVRGYQEPSGARHRQEQDMIALQG